MNYAEEQLQNAIENEMKQCDNTECGRNVSNECKMSEHKCIKMYKDYKNLWEQSVKENEKLQKAINFKNKCFYELNDTYIEMGKENKKLKEENQKLRELAKLLL